MRKKIGFKLVLVIAIVLSFIPGEIWAAGSSVHPSNQWTRQSVYKSPKQPKIKWAVDLGQDTGNMVIDSNNTIYAVGQYNFATKLTAVSPDGKIKWSVQLEGETNDLALYNDNTIVLSIFDAKNGSIIAAYSTDGELIWENKYADAASAFQPIALSSNGTIVATTRKQTNDWQEEEARVIALSVTGEQLFDISTTWKHKYLKVSSPIIVKDHIYFTVAQGTYRQLSKSGAGTVDYFNGGKLIKMDLNGKIKWSAAYKAEYNEVSPVYTNNLIYVQSQGALFMFSPEGVLKKTITDEKGYNFSYSPSFSENGTFIFGHRLYNSAGKLLWSFNPQDDLKSKKYIQNTVLIDRDQNALYTYRLYDDGVKSGVTSVNLKTKKTNWSLPLYQHMSSPPVLGSDGTLYVGGDRKLFAISEK